MGEPLTGNVFYRVKERVTSVPWLYLRTHKKKKMTQFSPLIGRHDYFLKGKVNNKILSRILNGGTITALVLKLKQREELFSTPQTGSVTELAEF